MRLAALRDRALWNTDVMASRQVIAVGGARAAWER
jgi:hypothetical protein